MSVFLDLIIHRICFWFSFSKRENGCSNRYWRDALLVLRSYKSSFIRYPKIALLLSEGLKVDHPKSLYPVEGYLTHKVSPWVEVSHLCSSYSVYLILDVLRTCFQL